MTLSHTNFHIHFIIKFWWLEFQSVTELNQFSPLQQPPSQSKPSVPLGGLVIVFNPISLFPLSLLYSLLSTQRDILKCEVIPFLKTFPSQLISVIFDPAHIFNSTSYIICLSYFFQVTLATLLLVPQTSKYAVISGSLQWLFPPPLMHIFIHQQSSVFYFFQISFQKNVPCLSYCRYEDVPPDPISRKNMLLSCGEYNQQIASSHQLLQGLPPLQKMAHSSSCLSCGSPHSLAE